MTDTDWRTLVELIAAELRTQYLGHEWHVRATCHVFAAEFHCTPAAASTPGFVDLTRLLSNAFESRGLRARATFATAPLALTLRVAKPPPRVLQRWASNVCDWSARFAFALVAGGAITWIAGTHPALSAAHK